MHFWIDKRSSQLHSYGGSSRCRVPGPGGFYTRAFGNRMNHPHPPPQSTRNQAQIQNHSAHHSNGQGGQGHGHSISAGHAGQGQIPVPVSVSVVHGHSHGHQGYHHINGYANPISTVHLPMPSSPNVGYEQQFQLQHGRNSPFQYNQMDGIYGHGHGHNPSGGESGTEGLDLLHGTQHLSNPQVIRMGHGQGSVPLSIYHHDPAVSGQGGHLEPYGNSFDPVIALANQYLAQAHNSRHNLSGSSTFSGRRPRSHSHGHAIGGAGRRRSSSSSNGSASHHRRSSSARWSYDPYNIAPHQHHQRHINMAHMWPEGRPNLGENLVLSSDPRIVAQGQPHLQNLASIPLPPQGGSQPQGQGQGHGQGQGRDRDRDRDSNRRQSSSTFGSASHSQYIMDPGWRRTKRIGLTLCFMAFILLSTVAAKFVIEGPWLIDRQPRHERTEATIYFFLTELIFIVFAVGLFFAGVTCLRKRTNAYLLRQFNQYIMQTAPQSGESLESPTEFFGRPGNHSGVAGEDRNFLPLENRLMNMHISVAENSSMACKPPPYHIALYLPVPLDDVESLKEGGENQGQGQGQQGQCQGQGQNPQPQASHSSSWISSCLADNENEENDADPDNENGSGSDKTEDHVEDPDDDENTNREGRKRSKERKKKSGKRRKREEDEERAETPPPPYPL